jgi:hypothetical protein
VAVDTFIAYSGVYGNVQDAIDDYDAVKRLHTEAGLIDAYDAAVIEGKENGKVKIVKNTRPRPGWVECSGVGSGWPRDWSSPCSPPQPSEAASCWGPPPAGLC